MSGYLWMIRHFGLRRTLAYARERRHRDRIYGPFDPTAHGEALLRRVGATPAQVAEAKRRGLA